MEFMKYSKKYLSQKIIYFIFITSTFSTLLSMDNQEKKGFPFEISPKKELKLAGQAVLDAQKMVELLEIDRTAIPSEKLAAQENLKSAVDRYTQALNNCPLEKLKIQATNSIRSFMDSLKAPPPEVMKEIQRLQNKEDQLKWHRETVKEMELSGNAAKHQITRLRNLVQKEEQELASALVDFKKQHKIVDNPVKTGSPLANAKVQATNSIRSFMDSLKGPTPIDPSETLRILQNREYTLKMSKEQVKKLELSGNTSKQVISRRKNELLKEEQEFAGDLEDFKKRHKIIDNQGKKDFAIEQKRGASIQNQPIDESEKPSSNSYGRAIGKLAKSVGQKTALPLVAITELACKTDAAKHSVFAGFCEGFNDEKMLLADAETQNAHRDAYVRNAISVASDILLLRANPVLGATVIGSTQAKKVRSLIEESENKEINDLRKAETCRNADIEIEYFCQQKRDAERAKATEAISIFHDAIENAKLTKEKFGCPEHPFCRRADLEIVFLENEKRRAEIDQDYENVSYFDGKIKYEKLKKERFGCSEFSSDDNSIDPDADSFYYAYISSLCEGGKEILKASRPILKPILKVGEIIDQAKKEIDHQIGDGAIAGLDAFGITEENLNKITSFVQEAMTYAPPYIQKSWNELIGIKDAEGATHMSLPRTPKRQLAKKILDDSLIQRTSEERDEQLAAAIEEYNQQVRTAIAHTITRAQLGNLNAESHEDNIFDDQEFDYPKFRKYIHGAFRGLTSIATIFGHDNTAYRLSMTGSASLELMDAMDSFLKDGLSCGIDPYLGALSAVATISLLCRKKEKDNSAQVILDAVNRGIMYLSEQIYRFEKNVLQNFVEMFKNDNRHHIIMLEKFGALHLDQENFEQNFESFSEYVKNNHEAIQNGIDALSKQANNNFRMTLDNLNGLRVEEIDDLIKLSLLKRENLSTEEFCRYVDELYVKATARASADSLTGGSIDLNSLDGVQNILEGSTGRRNIFEHPAFSNINLLSKYIENTCENFKHEKLVNPIIWIKCVEALLYLINQKIENDVFYPSTEDGKGLDLDKLMMLKNEGEKIIKFLERIDKNQYLKKIARDYQSRLQELADAIMQEKASYEEKQNQKLCRKHRINIEHEKAKIANRLSDGDQCKKCVENITEGLKSAAKAREMRNRGDSSYLQALGRFHIKGAQNNIDIFDKALNRDLKTVDIHNPTERFKKVYAEYLRAVQEKEAHLLNSTKLDLAQNTFSPVGEGMLSWIYPHDIDLPILMLPKEKLPIDPVYIVAENKGIGYITHYYSIIDKDFHLESFFNFKEDNRSIKILHLRKPHDFRSKTYTTIENINHFWYGGRYPKEEIDTFEFRAFRHYKGLGILSEGYFPPESPYPAEKDVFVSTAHKEIDEAEEYLEEVESFIQQNQNKNRFEFNQEVINHILSHSTTSSIFKAAQHVDVCFKILDSLLTLIYNDIINETDDALHSQFAAIRSGNDEKCIKNFVSYDIIMLKLIHKSIVRSINKVIIYPFILLKLLKN